MDRTIALVATGTVVTLIVAATIATSDFGKSLFGHTDPFAECGGGQVAGSIGGPFTLVDATGKTVTDADVITEPTFVYFGYTFCPDVCPLDSARNAAAVDLLAEQGISATPVFISIDPARDTPQVVGEFAHNFSDKMIGLTGSPEQVAAASRAYKTYFSKNDDDPVYYTVDHSTFTYLALPGVGVVDFFNRDDSAEVLAERAACFASVAAG
jgi:protein SCO1/2